jgi:hypothetical protein
MARVYKIEEGGLHEKFQACRKKIQIFGGGFGNGKTTGAVLKALQLCRDYPGSNGLIARSTYPKLNDTIRKEFLAWCPPAWIERKNLSQDNVVQLKNGTVINFRYIQQGGKSNESSTSNLLSATYDWIVVDQVEDPEIGYKDFLDLLGRLRGQTLYTGDDETMPSSGPRWMILMCNPTRNWVYRMLIKPLKDLEAGIKNKDLLVDEKTGEPIVALFEGSTYENKANLPADFIEGLESSYKGQMRERFLMGQWGAYEGLVYPEYTQPTHQIAHDDMVRYLDELRGMGVRNNIIEAYDHGIASPACYGLGFTDNAGNVFLLDGYYEKEKTIKELASAIHHMRKQYDIDEFQDSEEHALKVLADPAIFKRTSGNSRSVGVTVAGMFREDGIQMIRGNNDIISGIAKVQSYLYIDKYHRHPITQAVGAPRLYISDKCTWFDAEISDYYWKKNNITGEYEDLPMDRNDHSMDMIKYLFTNRPRVAMFPIVRQRLAPKYRRWQEVNSSGVTDRRMHRHGR